MTPPYRSDQPTSNDSPRLNRLGATPVPLRLRPRQGVLQPRRRTPGTRLHGTAAHPPRRRDAVGPRFLPGRIPRDRT